MRGDRAADETPFRNDTANWTPTPHSDLLWSQHKPIRGRTWAWLKLVLSEHLLTDQTHKPASSHKARSGLMIVHQGSPQAQQLLQLLCIRKGPPPDEGASRHSPFLPAGVITAEPRGAIQTFQDGTMKDKCLLTQQVQRLPDTYSPPTPGSLVHMCQILGTVSLSLGMQTLPFVAFLFKKPGPSASTATCATGSSQPQGSLYRPHPLLRGLKVFEKLLASAGLSSFVQGSFSSWVHEAPETYRLMNCPSAHSRKSRIAHTKTASHLSLSTQLSIPSNNVHSKPFS